MLGLKKLLYAPLVAAATMLSPLGSAADQEEKVTPFYGFEVHNDVETTDPKIKVRQLLCQRSPMGLTELSVNFKEGEDNKSVTMTKFPTPRGDAIEISYSPYNSLSREYYKKDPRKNNNEPIEEVRIGIYDVFHPGEKEFDEKKAKMISYLKIFNFDGYARDTKPRNLEGLITKLPIQFTPQKDSRRVQWWGEDREGELFVEGLTNPFDTEGDPNTPRYVERFIIDIVGSQDSREKQVIILKEVRPTIQTYSTGLPLVISTYSEVLTSSGTMYGIMNIDFEDANFDGNLDSVSFGRSLLGEDRELTLSREGLNVKVGGIHPEIYTQGAANSLFNVASGIFGNLTRTFNNEVMMLRLTRNFLLDKWKEKK